MCEENHLRDGFQGMEVPLPPRSEVKDSTVTWGQLWPSLIGPRWALKAPEPAPALAASPLHLSLCPHLESWEPVRLRGGLRQESHWEAWTRTDQLTP